MCGRISYSIHRAELLATYEWLKDAPEEKARYNIAPTDPVLAVGPDRAEVVRWGIEGRKGGLFNIRAETAIIKPYYHRLLLGQRVIVPASHFYEWRGVGGRRLPVAVSRADGKVLNLAGLLGSWEGRPATTILTTVPNGDIVPLHNRMPVVLNDDDAATWVLEELSLEQIAEFLKPCPDGWLRLAPASPLVNDVRNQGPELLDPPALPPEFQLELMPPSLARLGD
jgi:putative SOS response-associated peptidase YedK